jgi:cardiolipin synthase
VRQRLAFFLPLARCALAILLVGCAYVPILQLGPNGTALDDQALQLSLQDALAESKPIRGNQVTLLRDGDQTLAAMFSAMAKARDHINLEYYTFDNVKTDGGARTLGDLLLDRMAAGVQVNIIYDSFGSQDTSTAFLDGLHQRGAHLLAFNPGIATKAGNLVNPNDRDHRKIMVIDGRTAFIGGINLDPVYENRGRSTEDDDPANSVWHDIDARIDGPAVADLQRLFLHTWADQTGEKLPERAWFPPLPPRGNQVVRIIGSVPGDKRPLYYVSALTAIHAARHSISISTGYFVPTHQEREELSAAARRGVRVRLILPGKSDSSAALAAGHAAYDDLLEAGVEIAEMRHDVLHAKIMIVDGVWTALGSSNFDRRSVVFNNEVDAVILGSETGQTLETMLEQDRARAAKVDLATWRARPLADRPREFLSRFWQFML